VQFDVETAFNATGALTPYAYWIGLRRPDNVSAYAFEADGSAPLQVPSSSPYAHWSWVQAVAAAQAGFDCVIAQGAFAYDLYLGDGWVPLLELHSSAHGPATGQPCSLASLLDVGCSALEPLLLIILRNGQQAAQGLLQIHCMCVSLDAAQTDRQRCRVRSATQRDIKWFAIKDPLLTARKYG
jgi:hypothetical protein